MRKQSPPMAVWSGATTVRTALAAMQASTAEPPRASTAEPASVARRWGVEIMASVDRVEFRIR
jgi:hypothetical protein